MMQANNTLAEFTINKLGLELDDAQKTNFKKLIKLINDIIDKNEDVSLEEGCFIKVAQCILGAKSVFETELAQTIKIFISKIDVTLNEDELKTIDSTINDILKAIKNNQPIKNDVDWVYVNRKSLKETLVFTKHDSKELLQQAIDEDGASTTLNVDSVNQESVQDMHRSIGN